jgi:hypothetical protein
LSAGAGFAVSFGLTALIAHYGDVPPEVSTLATPDVRALLATAALSILTTLVFALAPALTATRFEVLPALKDEGVTSTAAQSGTRLRRVFVIAQVALSLTLLIVAGLFLQSLSKAMRVDPGFEPHSVASVSFDPDLQGYSRARRDALLTQFVERASSMPGAISAAVTSSLPMNVSRGGSVVAEAAATPARALFAGVSPRYFETLGISLVSGRDFSQTDTADALPVAIVNETLAGRLWPGVDPIGQRLRDTDAKAPWREVVGVVRDAKYQSDRCRAVHYSPAPAAGFASVAAGPNRGRSAGDAVAVDGDAAARSGSPLFQVQTLKTLFVARQLCAPRPRGCVRRPDLLLAAIGVYGSPPIVRRYAPAKSDPHGLVLVRGTCLECRARACALLIGVAAGLAISTAASRFLTAFLFTWSRGHHDVRRRIGDFCLAAVAAIFPHAERRVSTHSRHCAIRQSRRAGRLF